MNTGLRIYVSAMTVLAAAVLGYAFVNWQVTDWPRYTALLLVSILASGMKITLSAGAGTMSMNFLFFLEGIRSQSLGETLLMGVMGTLVQRFVRANNPATWVQVVFNVANISVSIGCAYAVYHGGVQSRGLLDAPVMFLLATSAFFMVNTLAVSGAIALEERRSPWQVWHSTYLWSFPNYLMGGAVVAVLGAASTVLGVQAFVLLLPILYAIYRSHTAYVEQLEESRKRAEQQRLHAEELATLHRRTIETLALAIEAKDQTTHDHLARVEVYAVEIGRQMALSEAELKALEAAALLHDIGKLAVPEYIISKPGKLTPDEFEKMKIHPVVGAELVERVRFPYPVAPIVRAHHEKWDGSGYPDGLAGEAIPIGARILSTVDCLDALATDRQYRRALPLPEALEFVQKQAGKAFDPKVVEILSRNYVELERKAKASALAASRSKLSTDLSVERGAAPDAGFEKGLSNLQNSVLAADGVAILARLDAALSTCQEPSHVFTAVRNCLQRAIPYQALVFYACRYGRMVPEFSDGEASQQFASLEIPLGMGLAGWVAENHKAILNGNPSVEPGYLNDPARFSTLSSALAVPVEFPDGPCGVLSVYRKDRDSFQDLEMQMLQKVASRAGAAWMGRVESEVVRKTS